MDRNTGNNSQPPGDSTGSNARNDAIGDSNGNPDQNVNSTTPAPNTNNNGGTQDITVSIQYSFPLPFTLGNPHTPANAGENPNLAQNPTGPDPSTDAATTAADGASASPASASMAPDGTGPANQDSAPQMRARTIPNAALILSFRDVPNSTPRSTLENIITIATELTMRRFNDFAGHPKGISREQFEELPVLKLCELTEEQLDTGCAICFETYVEEPDIEPLEKIKEARSEEDDTVSAGIKEKKRRIVRDSETTIPTPGTGVTTGGHAAASSVTATQRTPVVDGEHQTVHRDDQNTSTEENPQTSNTNGQESLWGGNPNNQESSPEEEQPTYLHSPTKLPCGHIFGRDCIFKWSHLENSCPLCRKAIVVIDRNDASQNNPLNEANREHLFDPAIFQRLGDMLYNQNQTNGPAAPGGDANANNETTAENDANGAGTNTNNTTPGTPQNPGVTAPLFGGGPSIIFIRPNFLRTGGPVAENSERTAGSANGDGRVASDPQRSIDPSTSSSVGDTTATGETGGNGAQAEQSPYDRFRRIFQSFFQGVEYAREDEAEDRRASQPVGEYGSSDQPGTAEASHDTNGPFRLGNNFTRMFMRGGLNNNNETLFNSGVASQRNGDGSVSTYHLGANDVFHANDANSPNVPLQAATDSRGTRTNSGLENRDQPRSNDDEGHGVENNNQEHLQDRDSTEQ
ncbi:ubiquitin-protein ligase SAN1 KNAG_0G02390 [Huiozyma naganishii CBS 8797]|uniref:RING-type domain-containing protein n=1 Tax=Huiozyma naganishii (strain ATCC MYA-139 / BCRC 22969 / CBS 8797 / KCTC 17520 / NBRC 10181 / NCYC 3082 / Yp74L-3) TaxID=1071383 RepID=J7S149_HUIN7|nr:hypothetical protein KNAG_0G02390 [Kazachstania naganishii CBS 8797]CCK71297.1 hypothetical protein KNAG_0G02390 [Kazachstania naganishii CBS 8797]